jgi:hypothetical protein
MDTFDGSKPNLISSRTLKDIESKLDVQIGDEGNRVINGLGTFYTNYIAPNMFPLIVITLLILYLTIKYILKRDREEREDEEEEKKIDRIRVKKRMVKVDPDELLETNNNKPIIDTTIIEDNKDADISDMISDDYLLTDDDNNIQNQQDTNFNREMQDMTQVDINNALNNRDTTYNMDKAAAVVFGKDHQEFGKDHQEFGKDHQEFDRDQ